MYAPHTVTLYSILEDPVTFDVTNHITILSGVLMEAAKAANVRESGLEGADSVNLYIPLSVRATDGVTGEKREYIPPKAFADAADKSGLWTLEVSKNCFFVKDEVVEPSKTFQTINANYDDVYRVTKVDRKDYGSQSMQHWEVGGA